MSNVYLNESVFQGVAEIRSIFMEILGKVFL